MKTYADTNFFARLYIETRWLSVVLSSMDDILRESSSLPVHWLHRIELRNAIELFVYASAKGDGPRVTREMAAVAQARFRSDLADMGSPLSETGLDLASLERETEELCLRHSASSGFRTYEILHVAAARLLGCERFWSFDAKCNDLARLEGLSCPPTNSR